MIKRYFWLCALCVLPALMTGCTADDDGPESDNELWQGTLAAAPFAEEAVSFELSNAPYSRIELTSNGFYYIVPASTDRKAASKPMHRSKITRSDVIYSEIVQGVFHLLADGSYDLTGIGTVKWNVSTGKLEVSLKDGKNYAWDAVKESKIDPNVLNNRICRTWKIYKAWDEYYSEDGKLIHTKKYTDAELKDEYITYFTFTSAGNLYEYDEGWDTYTWKWTNPSKQMMYVEDLTEGEESDEVFQVLFKGDEITIVTAEPCYDDENAPAGASYVRICFSCKNYLP